MGSRKGSPNKRILELLPEALLRHLYQELDMTDSAIAKQIKVKRDTVKKMRDFYAIPKMLKTKGSLEWHARRTSEEKTIAAKKNWQNRGINGTRKTGRVPSSAFKKGHDNGKLGKTHEELYGIEKAQMISAKISSHLIGQNVGSKNPMYGKLPLNRKNNHRGGYVDSPLQGKVWMRSSWEIEYANYLTRHSILWLYESQCFDIGNGRSYWPDFYLIVTNEWHEVKGYMTDLDKQKLDGMINLHNIHVKVIDLQEMKALNLRIRPRRI